MCGFACLAAALALGTPDKTAICMLADKEEIGSQGVTGMKSAAFDTFVSDLCDAQRVPLKACYEKSFCLSTDVTAAFDPNFAEVYEKRNSARVNYGVGLCKYTGARGKSGASDASAEVVGYVRKVLDEANVVWQMAELGKVGRRRRRHRGLLHGRARHRHHRRRRTGAEHARPLRDRVQAGLLHDLQGDQGFLRGEIKTETKIRPRSPRADFGIPKPLARRVVQKSLWR